MSKILNFLRPNDRKLWIFIAIIIGSFFAFLVDRHDNALNSFITAPLSLSQYFGFEIGRDEIVIIIMVLVIYWYLFSCCLFTLISKFRKI